LEPGAVTCATAEAAWVSIGDGKLELQLQLLLTNAHSVSQHHLFCIFFFCWY
jgi:hypothetical protein